MANVTIAIAKCEKENGDLVLIRPLDNYNIELWFQRKWIYKNQTIIDYNCYEFDYDSLTMKSPKIFTPEKFLKTLKTLHNGQNKNIQV
jgi:hypothetical protein